jgi:hypothetical protein
MLGQRLRDVDVRCHRQRVYARVSAASSMHSRQLPGHPMDRFLERLLGRRTVVLSLPPHERPAVELDR